MNITDLIGKGYVVKLRNNPLSPIPERLNIYYNKYTHAFLNKRKLLLLLK